MKPIAASVVPPATGLEKEEPEFAEEDDIPSDDQPTGVTPPGRSEYPKQ